MIDYAQKIKEYRKIKLLKQTELAEILGVSKTSVTRWENGHFEPTIEIKKKLRQLFLDSGIV